MWYQTDTVGGSSGSPVFNNSWDVVALHHSGVPRTRIDSNGTRIFLTRDGTDWDPSMGDDAIDWFANEGIRISRIVDYLATICPNHPLAQQILRGKYPPVHTTDPAMTETITTPHLDDQGVLRLDIPIEVRIGSFAAPTAPPPTLPTGDGDDYADPVRPAAPHLVESVEVDQDYSTRNGYQPDFLGEDATVALPTINQATQNACGKAALNGTKLTYNNYSVVFNADRRLAYYSACNIRSDLFKGERADGDKWFHDPRLARLEPKPAEVDDSWYGQQSTFEADRTPNPFDRGHLCARNHLQWGETLDDAKRNGDDSFHFTNCTPQHWQFNQNSKINGLWFATEDEVLRRTDTTRLCVINGPVFDAPVSEKGADGLWRLDPTGPRAKDPIFGGVAIPKQFFKIIVWHVDRRLRYLAFVVTQEGLLETIDGIDWPELTEGARKPQGLTDGEAALYRVPLTTVAHLTGLGFRTLGNAVQPAITEATDDLTPVEGLSGLAREIARIYGRAT